VEAEFRGRVDLPQRNLKRCDRCAEPVGEHRYNWVIGGRPRMFCGSCHVLVRVIRPAPTRNGEVNARI
jgi:hypothetical protein